MPIKIAGQEIEAGLPEDLIILRPGTDNEIVIRARAFRDLDEIHLVPAHPRVAERVARLRLAAKSVDAGGFLTHRTQRTSSEWNSTVSNVLVGWLSNRCTKSNGKPSTSKNPKHGSTGKTN